MTGMVSLLGESILPFQIYVCVKTKDDQTATGLQKLKTYQPYALYQWCLYIAHLINTISTFICYMHYLAFYFHFLSFSLKLEEHILSTKVCSVIQRPIVSKCCVIWLHTVPAYHCKLVSSHSNVHWPYRNVCCLRAGCTLGYRCRTLWIQKLYQRKLADHFQELSGQDHNWQLQGRHSYNYSTFLVTIMKANANLHIHIFKTTHRCIIRMHHTY